jgi:hypothetical protein
VGVGHVVCAHGDQRRGHGFGLSVLCRRPADGFFSFLEGTAVGSMMTVISALVQIALDRYDISRDCHVYAAKLT